MIVAQAIQRLKNTAAAGLPVEQTMLLIFKDMVKETNIEIYKLRPDKVEVIAALFETKACEYSQICESLPRLNLNPNGFRLMFRQASPNLYRALIQHGFKEIPKEEDPLFVPDGKKRHKSKGDNDGKNSGTI